MLAGAGALRSTMNDMLKFARANLAPHDAKSASWGPRPTRGRLQQVMQRTHVLRASAGKEMSIGDENKGLAAVVLTNSSHGADDLGFELLK